MLLVGVYALAGLTAWGQNPAHHSLRDVDVALVYHPTDANLVGGDGFWMQGAGVQLHDQFWRGLGATGDAAVLHTSAMNNQSAGLDLVTATFGPRYTWSRAHSRYALFGQFLAGEAFGSHSVFPGATTSTDSATSMALLAGGGLNVHLRKRLSLRALEANWLRTTLPNASTNVQNSLRLGAGLVFQF